MESHFRKIHAFGRLHFFLTALFLFLVFASHCIPDEKIMGHRELSLHLLSEFPRNGCRNFWLLWIRIRNIPHCGTRSQDRTRDFAGTECRHRAGFCCAFFISARFVISAWLLFSCFCSAPPGKSAERIPLHPDFFSSFSFYGQTFFPFPGHCLRPDVSLQHSVPFCSCAEKKNYSGKKNCTGFFFPFTESEQSLLSWIRELFRLLPWAFLLPLPFFLSVTMGQNRKAALCGNLWRAVPFSGSWVICFWL